MIVYPFSCLYFFQRAPCIEICSALHQILSLSSLGKVGPKSGSITIRTNSKHFTSKCEKPREHIISALLSMIRIAIHNVGLYFTIPFCLSDANDTSKLTFTAP